MKVEEQRWSLITNARTIQHSPAFHNTNTEYKRIFFPMSIMLHWEKIIQPKWLTTIISKQPTEGHDEQQY